VCLTWAQPADFARQTSIRSYHSNVRLILASGSPRRAELLRAAGFSFDVVVPEVDETRRSAEPAEAYVRRLSQEKSSVALGGVRARDDETDRRIDVSRNSDVIIAADTVVVVDGDLLGKPRDQTDAASMLRRLSGRWHEVMTGISVRSALRETGSVAVTRVQFAELSAADIDWYVTSGETADKAGAYAIQGLASRFIPRIEGSYTNVVGLPISLVQELLKRFERGYSDR
jgi:nucleoside triphosphate pyrophosphatase